MDFVDDENGVGFFGEGLEDGFDAVFEVATVACACEQRAHVERKDFGVFEVVGDAAFVDAQGESLGDGGFSDAGVADE